ncbi:MAG: hypothetical protein ACK4NS_01750 [Saprospiraceae bacterium]
MRLRLRLTILAAAILTALVLFVSCKNDTSKPSEPQTPHASPNLLGGHWIAMDFCRRASQYGSVVRAIDAAPTPFAFGVTFTTIKPDSVTCYNGIEEWTLGVKYRKDTLEMPHAMGDRSAFWIYDSGGDRKLTLFGVENNSVYLHEYIKSTAGAANGMLAFRTALNANLFSGAFLLISAKSQNQILFTPGGFINGMQDFDRYEVCVSGDCFATESTARSDVMTLRNSKKEGSETIFAWEYNDNADTLTLYNLRNTHPQEKGAYARAGIAYRFLRKKPF